MRNLDVSRVLLLNAGGALRAAIVHLGAHVTLSRRGAPLPH
jgi:hypothetical protein